MTLFKDSIVAKVEKKKKLELQIANLKKQQKQESEETLKKYQELNTNSNDNIDRTIANLKSEIARLNALKKSIQEINLEKQKVELDKKMSSFDLKMIKLQNKVKKLTNYIDAEKKNMEDIIESESVNAPRQKVLLESKKD